MALNVAKVDSPDGANMPDFSNSYNPLAPLGHVIIVPKFSYIPIVFFKNTVRPIGAKRVVANDQNQVCPIGAIQKTHKRKIKSIN